MKMPQCTEKRPEKKGLGKKSTSHYDQVLSGIVKLHATHVKTRAQMKGTEQGPKHGQLIVLNRSNEGNSDI